MSNPVKQIVLFGVLLVLVGALTLMSYEKEMTLATGQVVLLELAPVDPRSLLQGDYMALRYRLAQTLRGEALPRDGKLVVTLDENGVAAFKRVYSGEPLSPGELLLRYRKRSNGIRLGAESFFFQEGHAGDYRGAKYGELRVSGSGDSVLAGLRGQERERLGEGYNKK